jgi:hypothetical protein
MIPQREPCGQRFPVSEPMFYSFIHISPSSQLKSSPTKQGKICVYRPRSSMRTEGLHTMGYGLVPQRDRIRQCYYYPSAIKPSAQ